VLGVEPGLPVERLVVVDRHPLQRHGRGEGGVSGPEGVPAGQPLLLGSEVGVEGHEGVGAVADLPAAVEQHDVRALTGLDGRAEERVVLLVGLRHELDLGVRVLRGEGRAGGVEVAGGGRVAGLPVPDHELLPVPATLRQGSGAGCAAARRQRDGRDEPDGRCEYSPHRDAFLVWVSET
jgi:hypothetical protein